MKQSRVISGALVVLMAGAGAYWLTQRGEPGRSSDPADPIEPNAREEPEKPSDPTQSRFTARVWGPGGEGVVGATMRIGEKSYTSGEAGVVQATHPGEGVHQVAVEAAGLTFAKGAGCCEAIALPAPEKTKLLTLTVHRPATVQGVVVSAGRPVGGAELVLHYRVGRGLTRQVKDLRLPVPVKSGADGSFVLSGLAAGRLRIEASAGGRKALGPLLELAPGGRGERYIIDIRAVAALSGQVQSLAGAPVASATIEVGDGSAAWRANSDPMGRFKLIGMPPGTWQVEVSAPGFEPHREQKVAFFPHAAVSRVFRLKPITGVAGKVVDVDGQPVIGATVVVLRGAETHWVRTEAGGRFRYGEAADDVRDARLVAIHPEHAPSDEQPADPGREQVLQMGAGGRIVGLVTTPGGAVEQSANVAIAGRRVAKPDPHGEPLGREVVAKVDGTFVMGPLRPGRYDLLARSAGKNPGLLRDVVVESGKDTEVILHMDAGATLVGNVTLQGAAVVGAKVTVFARAGIEELVRGAVSRDGGGFVVDKLPPGEAKLRVTANGALAEVLTLKVPERGELRRDVVLRPAGGGEQAVVERIGAKLVETDKGVVLTGIRDDGPAGKAGITDGDVLVSVDFQRAQTRGLRELAALLNNAPPAQLTVEVVGADGQRKSLYLDL